MRILIILFFCIYSGLAYGNEFFCRTDSFKRAHVGIYVLDLETGEQVYADNEDQFFVPASLQKIVTSAAALSVLGEDHRFYTDLEYEGKIDRKGVLHGNVWVRGGGDPTLSLDIFTHWEEALKKAGIHKIEGKICIDQSSFEKALASPYWLFQDLGNYYGAGACALTVNQNLYRITFQPGKKEGDPTSVVKIDPEIPGLHFHNEVTTGPAGSGDKVYVYGTEYSPEQFYRGTVPLDEPTFTVKASIPDPALFCAKVLSSKISASKGIEVIKEPTRGTRQLFHRNASPPLKEILKEMNKYSINVYAEILLKTIGSGHSTEGAAKTEQFLKQWDIPCKVQDGSGLSRTNFITPKGFAALLFHMRKSSQYQSLYESFPAVEGMSLKAKTGSMWHIYNMGGYLTLSSGKEYVFCICCNNYPGPNSEIKAEIRAFLENFSLH